MANIKLHGIAAGESGKISTSRDSGSPVQLTPCRFVTIELASVVTGYSRKAIERKIERGDWAESREYVRAPDGRILVDLRGYAAWALRSTSNVPRRGP
jgi:hypothetical protein